MGSTGKAKRYAAEGATAQMTETLWYVQLYEGDTSKPKSKLDFSDFDSVRSCLIEHKNAGKRETIVVVVPPHASKEERAELRALGARLM